MPDTARAARLARRVAELQPSATLVMIGRVRRLQAAGRRILDLTAGEPDFGPPKAAEEAAIRAVQEGRGRYTPAAGIPELRSAAADLVRRDLGLDYAPEELVVTPGAKIGISQALFAVVEPGQEVLIPTPCWTSYPEMVRIASGQPVPVPCDAARLPQVEALEAARTERTAGLMLNTPSNPTGAVYPEELLRKIGEWALQHGIWVISDEIYAALTFGGARHVSPIAAAPGLREQAIWIGGMSKAYAMTGWRMGFTAAPEPVASAIAGLQSQLVSCPSAISQHASLAAIQHGDAEREAMRLAFERRSRSVSAALQAIPDLSCALPEGAFYAFPSARAYLGTTDPDTGRRIESGDDLCEVLLEADGIGVIGGSPFGAPDAFRLSFAASDEVLEEALAGITRRFARLRESRAGGQS